MYAVIDLNTIPVCKTRGEGERFLANLRLYNSEAKWQLMVGITEAPLEELELLYALSNMLLEASGINPLTIGIKQAHADGSETEHSAVNIMNNARSWLDQVQDTH